MLYEFELTALAFCEVERCQSLGKPWYCCQGQTMIRALEDDELLAATAAILGLQDQDFCWLLLPAPET
jgi:hypothetical protein